MQDVMQDVTQYGCCHFAGCVLNFLHDVNKKYDSITGAEPPGPIIVHCR